MKKMLRAIAYVLAINFLAVIGAAAYLWRDGHLDRAKALAIGAVLFPPQTEPSTTQPSSASTTQPALQLQDLLQKASGLSAEDQVEFLQRSFDARMAQLDMRQRELADRKAEIDFASQRLASDRAALNAEKAALAATQQQAAQQANDQGFQDSLSLYNVMVPKQVKTIFMALSDATVERYLEAMTPQRAGKIIKEFKAPDETDRIQRILERMRQQNAPDTQPAQTTAGASGGP